MTDSISIIGPGWRATDSSGNIITDGILAFFDAGTSDARTVYSDSGLSTSLGTTVDCNSGGYPVTSGNARTLIYTGNTAYKVRLTSVLGGGTIWEHDNVLGALDTSSFLTEAAVADQSVVNISTSRSIEAADKGKLINVNCSGGVRTMTFDDAATLGDGFFVGIRHAGTANQVKITGDGVDTFAISGASPIGFSLTGQGQAVWISCDGTNFKVHSDAPPFVNGATGVITCVSQTSTPPGSPNPGDRHIVGSSPTGDWSGFSEHDIAEADGFGNWFNRTPPTDAGWLSYLQSDNRFLSFMASAWSIPGKVSIQVFTSSGTWTKPAGISRALVIGTGGGGAGSADTSTNVGQGGGGAGATCIELIDVSAITSETVTIGAAGAAASNDDGGSGGNTTFGSHFTANGGAGGADAVGGLGGTGSNGSLNVTGGDGSPGGRGDGGDAGNGGASFWGGGGRGSDDDGAGTTARAYGSGGGGSFQNATAGSGAAGIVVVLEFGF